MARSRAFSIYLLKEEFDAASALKDDNPLLSAVEAENLPPDAELFVLDSKPNPPWWKKYFGVQLDLIQSSTGALVFIPINDRVFALTFGHVAHNLKDESYEYDFGIKTTLNCIDPKKLKNTDTLDPGSARRRRTQHAIETELTYFDFDHDSSVLKSITGKVKNEYSDIVKNATGASNLRVTTPISPDELVKLCTQLLELYADESYLQTFPNIQKIAPVRDPDQIRALNSELESKIRTKADNIYLAVPELVDYSQDSGSLYASFSGVGQSQLYPEVLINSYFAYLERCGTTAASLTVEQLKAHRLHLADENGDTKSSYTIYKSLIFDAAIDDNGPAYYLTEGNWYEVDRNYVKALQVKLDPYWSELELLDDCKFRLEEEYNKEMGKKPGFVCLDKTSVAPSGQTQIEPCDLYTVVDDRATLIHVKISTDSSQLSHLFNQGTNSVELLKSEEEPRVNLVTRLQSRKKNIDDIQTLRKPIDSGEYSVIFAIITRKDPSKKSLNLPLFSRISLARNLRALDRVMNVPTRFGFIKDVSPKQPVKAKARKNRDQKKNLRKSG